ncbi:MAG: glycosyltransferase family 39 protein, partial [Desulfobacterales bacterium]|nr:glycosyltransferase family 39 protein [Desulfobacterales bacterium]
MRISDSTPDSSRAARIGRRLCITLGLLGAGLILSIIVLSWTPPVSRDALTHHLAVPKLYLEHGGIHEIPSIPFSYYPMNLDLLYMIPLYFGNDILPKYIHFSFALLTCWLIFRYLKKRTSPVFALLGVILFLSLPVVIKLSITVYVDLGLIFFSTAALLAFLQWMENDYRWRELLLSGLWCGLALGCKYNGLITLFLLSFFIPFAYSRRNRGTPGASFKALGFGAVFFLTALLIFSPWMARNILWKNNPVHPLFKSAFTSRAPGGAARDSAREVGPGAPLPGRVDASPNRRKSSGSFSNFAIRRIIYKESWLQIALIPVRIFFQGRDNDPVRFDGRLNPLLFFLPFFAFRGRKNSPPALVAEKKILLAFSTLFLLYAFVQTDMRIRYVGPIIPPLVILSIMGLAELSAMIRDRFSPCVARGAVAGVIIAFSFLFSFNVVYLFEQFRIVDPAGCISGRVTRDEYIEKRRPEYAALR